MSCGWTNGEDAGFFEGSMNFGWRFYGSEVVVPVETSVFPGVEKETTKKFLLGNGEMGHRSWTALTRKYSTFTIPCRGASLRPIPIELR